MLKNKILCIGGANIDWIGQYPAETFPIVNIPITFNQSFGGVAHNVAQHLKSLNHEVGMMTVIGDDDEGKQITNEIKSADFVENLIHVLPAQKTASILFVINAKGKHLFMQPRTEIYESIIPAMLEPYLNQMKSFDTWLIDTNFPQDVLQFLAETKPAHIKLYGVIACPPKSRRIIPVLPFLDALFLNQLEASLILNDEIKSIEQACRAAKKLRVKGVKQVFITLGEHGACANSEDFAGILPIIKVESTDTTGAGDAFTAGTLSALIKQQPTITCLRQGLAAASLAVEVHGKTYGMLTNKKIDQRGLSNA